MIDKNGKKRLVFIHILLLIKEEGVNVVLTIKQ